MKKQLFAIEWKEPDYLTHETASEAVFYEIDSLEGPLPKTIRVDEYALNMPREDEFRGLVLEWFLGFLDEDHSHNEATNPTSRMREAEETFIDAVIRDYDPSLWEKANTITVDVEAWLKVQEGDPRLKKWVEQIRSRP